MKSNVGFTLIEIIITLTVMAIAATMALTYTGGISFTQSAVPAGLVSNQYKLIEQMEQITSEYRKELQDGTIALNGFNTFNTYIANNYNVSASTELRILTDTTNSYNTQNVFMVTLTDGQQTLQSIFTK